MSENIENDDMWYRKYFPLILYGTLAVLGSVLFIACVALRPAAELANIEHKMLPSLQKQLPTDSISSSFVTSKDTVIYVSDYKARVAKVDSLYSDMYRLSERYREESAQLVDRTGAWMGFWIALICMLTGLFAFLQYNSMRNEIQELKAFKTLLEKKIDQKFVDKTEDLDKKSSEFAAKLSRMEHASKVAAISQCIMVLPDAEMSNDMDRGKELICTFHKMLVDNFDEYYHELKDSNDNKPDMQQIKVVLSMVRNSLSRVQAISSNPSNSIVLFKASKAVNDCLEKCLTGEVHKDNVISELEKINVNLNSVSAKLSNAANV